AAHPGRRPGVRAAPAAGRRAGGGRPAPRLGPPPRRRPGPHDRFRHPGPRRSLPRRAGGPGHRDDRALGRHRDVEPAGAVARPRLAVHPYQRHRGGRRRGPDPARRRPGPGLTAYGAARAWSRRLKLDITWSKPVIAKMRSTDALVTTSSTSPPSSPACLCAATSAWMPAVSQNSVRLMSTTRVLPRPAASSSAVRNAVALVISISLGVTTTGTSPAISTRKLRSGIRVTLLPGLTPHHEQGDVVAGRLVADQRRHDRGTRRLRGLG